jgi:phytoene dehydrogenase-like protein
VLRWSRRSAADVLRSFVDDESVVAPAMAVGPVVWGASPTTPGTGLGALTYAMKHVTKVGRPLGGSGALPQATRAAFEHHGGVVRTGTRVTAVHCEGGRVTGVGLDDGGVVRAPVVVAACDPRRLFVEWLRDPPPQIASLARRWRDRPHQQGYESKLDVVVDRLPSYRDDHHAGPTTVVSPPTRDLEAAHRLLSEGRVAFRPVFLVNVPTVLDPGMAPPGRHVLSIEVLYTPYHLVGGWPSSDEPRRWLELFAELVEPGFLDSIVDWRAMTPDRYEREFHLPKGHAASFAGGPLAALRASDRELTRYTTPVDGLYLTGAATFPGAGVWGASGRNTALTVLSRR